VAGVMSLSGPRQRLSRRRTGAPSGAVSSGAAARTSNAGGLARAEGVRSFVGPEASPVALRWSDGRRGARASAGRRRCAAHKTTAVPLPSPLPSLSPSLLSLSPLSSLSSSQASCGFRVRRAELPLRCVPQFARLFAGAVVRVPSRPARVNTSASRHYRPAAAAIAASSLLLHSRASARCSIVPVLTASAACSTNHSSATDRCDAPSPRVPKRTRRSCLTRSTPREPPASHRLSDRALPALPALPALQRLSTSCRRRSLCSSLSRHGFLLQRHGRYVAR
jgi:hypothetical protein